MSNPEFIVFTGPMFSGKTSKLLLTLEKFKYQNKKIIAFKPLIDDRYSDKDIVTHMGWDYKAHVIKNNVELLQILSDESELYSVVAIDEQFMIKGSSDILIWLFKKGVTVIVSTLDLSFQGKPFDEVQKILPYATRIEKCASVCTVCGNDAFYTHKKVHDENEIVIGGSDLYEPRCFQHFAKLNDVE